MEADSRQKQQRIIGILQDIQTQIHTHPEIIPDHMFQLLEGICSLVYRWREAQGKDGWSTQVLDLPSRQQTVLEGGFQTLDGFFNQHQLGGGWAPSVQTGAGVEYTSQPSLDEGYSSVLEYMKQVGLQWNQIQQALGIVNPETQEPMDGVLGFVSLFIEGIRIWIMLHPMDSETYRFFFSVSQGMLDAVRGDLKQALLSMLGIIDQQGLMVSVLGRFMVSLAAMKSMKFKSDMSLDIYKSTKTIVTTFLLWSFSLFAPDMVKQSIADSLTQVEELATEDTIDISTIKKKFIEASANAGLRTDRIPGFADLQRLQEIFQKKDITCSPQFKQLMKPISQVFSLRLAFDLAGIPTTDSEIASVCEAKLKGGVRRLKRHAKASTMKHHIRISKKKTRKS